MFPLYLMLLAFFTLSYGQSGTDTPPSIENPWILFNDGLQYEDISRQPSTEGVWPEGSTPAMEVVTEENHSVPDTAHVALMKEHASNEAVDELMVWKIVLVVAVLLVSAVGALSLAYYLCFWRGGRFYYQPQKEADP